MISSSIVDPHNLIGAKRPPPWRKGGKYFGSRKVGGWEPQIKDLGVTGLYGGLKKFRREDFLFEILENKYRLYYQLDHVKVSLSSKCPPNTGGGAKVCKNPQEPNCVHSPRSLSNALVSDLKREDKMSWIRRIIWREPWFVLFI